MIPNLLRTLTPSRYPSKDTDTRRNSPDMRRLRLPQGQRLVQHQHKAICRTGREVRLQVPHLLAVMKAFTDRIGCGSSWYEGGLYVYIRHGWSKRSIPV